VNVLKKIFRKVNALYIFLLFPFYLNSQDTNWPHLRGPDYDGISKSTNIVIPETGTVPLIWKKPFDQGYSGFVIADNRLFTQGQNRSGQYVICLDPITGKEIWRTRYGWPWELSGQYPGTYATPTYYNGKVFFSGCYGMVGCIEAETGKVVWSFDLKKRFGTNVTSFGYACTPLVEDDRVYLTLNGDADSSVIALKASDGATIWKSGNFAASYASPIPFKFNKKKQIISFLQNHLVANDSESGNILWTFKFSEGYDEHSSWPLIKDDHIYCASPFFKGMKALKVTEKDGVTAIIEEWQTKEMSNDIFSSVLVGDHIYGFHITDHQANASGNTGGYFKCLEANTGKRLWETQKTGHVNVVVARETLILFSEKGMLIYAEASPEGFKKLWRGEIFPDELCWTPPAIWKGRLYLRGEKHIACIALNNEMKTHTGIIKQKNEVLSLPALIDDWLITYQGDAFLSPGISLISMWYIFSLLVFAISALTAYFLYLKWGNFFYQFLVIAILLSIFSPLAFSPLTGSFIFTTQSVIYLGALFVIHIRYSFIKAQKSSRNLLSRLSLSIFIVLSALYFLCCDRLFIVAGLGFPFGLIPALPFAIILVKKVLREEKIIKTILLFISAHAVYFWSAAFLILIKTG
jgi:outer membrane protein assembly factor BamB